MPLHRALISGLLLGMLTPGVRAEELPYDAMARAFGVYLDPADADTWPAKVRAIAQDDYHFWRGTRDLFYAWAGEHCQDWLADRAALTVSHGDLHLGNLGSYAAAGQFGAVAYGIVDFDESARLPVQFELLQGVVTFELIARHNAIALTDADRARLRDTLFDTYASTLAAPPADLGMAALLKSRDGRPYQDDLDRFTQDRRFRTTVVKKGVVTDILRPIPSGGRPAIARALATAVQHDARLAAMLVPYDAVDFENAILDVAERTRVESSGSQGLSKILILLRQPFKGRDMDGLIYLKQQIPSAAERAGIIPAVDGSPGRRYARDMNLLTHGRALAVSWCDIGERSYWVSIKEPWSDEPDSKTLRDRPALMSAAGVWARAAADSHRSDAARLRPLLTPTLRAAVMNRADAYLTWQANAYQRLKSDERTARAIAAPERGLPTTPPPRRD